MIFLSIIDRSNEITNKRSLNLFGIHYINIVVTSREPYERNGTETIVDSEGILCLNKKYIEEGLDRKHLRETATKYYSDHRKKRHEIVTEPKTNAIEFL